MTSSVTEEEAELDAMLPPIRTDGEQMVNAFLGDQRVVVGCLGPQEDQSAGPVQHGVQGAYA